MILPRPPLLVITDRWQARAPLEDVVSAAIRGGCRWVSLREKDLSHADRAALLARLIALGRPVGATLLVHEDIDAAVAAGADGVHLPAGSSPADARHRLGEKALIGVSAHSLAEAKAAAARGADYVTVSPIFLSASKPGYGPALGLDALSAAAGEAGVPVVALGGVTEATAADCMVAGASGAAVMGGVMAAADPAAAARRLVALVEGAGLRGSGKFQ